MDDGTSRSVAPAISTVGNNDGSGEAQEIENIYYSHENNNLIEQHSMRMMILNREEWVEMQLMKVMNMAVIMIKIVIMNIILTIVLSNVVTASHLRFFCAFSIYMYFFPNLFNLTIVLT